MRKALVWFKNDLRLQDNEALHTAAASSDIVYPLYIFDPRAYRILPTGFAKSGPFRASFLIESVQSLRESLKARGSQLIVRVGKPEEIIPEIVQQVGISQVYTSKETGSEEQEIIHALESRLGPLKVILNQFWTHTLFHEEDVPWPIKQVPETFTVFRKESVKTVKVRTLFDVPVNWHVITDIEPGSIPTLDELNITAATVDSRTSFHFEGGETPAIQRLNYYLWESDRILEYKNTRNGLLGSDYSSKLSPWLSIGAISAKTVYYELKRYESERKKNSGTYWLFFELLWRDFFRFMAKKHGRKIFLPDGLTAEAPEFENDTDKFLKWQEARTGEAFIDANMNELNLTGYMSNRGRQNVASYLIHDLGVNWTWGAAWFENRLIDYDSSSNWLNWAYIAGVGNDPRKGRHFNIENQSAQYDPKGRYVRYWLDSEPALQ